MSKHQFFEILQRDPKSAAERALCSAVAFISTREGYSHLTPDAVFDKLAADWNKLGEQAPASQSEKSAAKEQTKGKGK